MNYLRSLIPFSLVLLSAIPLAADVKLSALFSDNMVLQQGIKVPVWGWADEGEKVEVTFANRTVSTVARDGKWKVELPELKSSTTPQVFTVTGRNRLELKEVLVGEVWIASGQSNMEWGMRSSYQPSNDIARATNPNIRLFTVPKLKANEAVGDTKSKWEQCGPATVANFSAVAYYFGRDLQKSLQVPIGLIHTSWGGSPAEVWIRNEILRNNPDYRRDLLDAYPAQLARHKESMAKWEAETAKLKSEGKKQTANAPWAPWKPSELYNGMIAPIIPFACKGAIWYQGESNADRAEEYQSLMADLILNWRNDWKQQEFAFLQVQLAPWDKNRKRSLEEISSKPEESNWAELREAQQIVAEKLPLAGVVVITDAGDKDDIHPAKKEPVGARLALAAQKIAYKKRITAFGPTYKSMKIQGAEIALTFDNLGSGLEAKDGELKGFAIAGEDRKFVWAKAEIQGNKVVVSSPDVSNPIAVRYGWLDYPVVNLFNREGLPASPFRTDRFPMITARKK